jgi:hypothetical protein
MIVKIATAAVYVEISKKQKHFGPRRLDSKSSAKHRWARMQAG